MSKLEEAVLKRRLFHNPGIFFDLGGKAFDRTLFLSIIDVLQDRVGDRVELNRKEEHWHVLQERMEGKAPWDLVVSSAAPDEPWYLSLYQVSNMVRRRPYLDFKISSIRYTVDVFNPRDELGLGYATADETVVTLVTQHSEASLIHNRQFYEIINEFDCILKPRTIVGMAAPTLATLSLAFSYEEIGSDVNPWTAFLFPLSIINLPKQVGDVSLDRYFKRFDRFADGRVLLQVNDGIGAELSQRYIDAARVLGMKAVQELHPEMRA